MTAQVSAQDAARIRKIAERIVWPNGLRGDADEMGFHVRNLDFLAQRIEAALQVELARAIEECAKQASMYWGENGETVVAADIASRIRALAAPDTGGAGEREKCGMCRGTGQTQPAMDLLARPRKEQREYQQSIADMEPIICPMCGGTGKESNGGESREV